MGFDKHWAETPAPRTQFVIISSSLDDMIGEGHAIRLMNELFDGLDWSEWEAAYDGGRGRPPIHPRYLAGAIFYGLMHRVRSSRELEDAACVRLDFIWFLEGHRPDHSTFAAFRTKHKDALKGLNRQICERIIASNADALTSLIIDGTRLRANSDRHGARTAKGLEKMIAACQAELNARLEHLESGDAALENPLPVQQQSLLEQLEQQEAPEDEVELDKEVKALRARLAQLEKARQTAEARDEVKRRASGKKFTPTRVPVTDPDAQITPNKEGGYAPNFTPIVAVDEATGAIMYSEVPEGSNEADAVQPAIEAARALGGTPERFLADSGFATNENFAALQDQDIQAVMPTGLDPSAANPVNRADLQTPVAEERKGDIPKTGGRYSQAAFVYDEERDGYYCPQGEFLPKTGHCQGDGENGSYTAYRCPNQGNCPRVGECTKAESGQRTIKRADDQASREQVSEYMATEEGQAAYKKRAPSVEGTFGTIKEALGIRRFLLRGLEKVRIEWDWICGVFNLKKLLVLQARSGQNTQTSADPRLSNPTTALIWAQFRPSHAPMKLAA
jgi:transposase